jgi:hypothetical protein
MRFQLTREFYVPKGAIKIADKESDAVAYLHADTRARPCAKIFYGAQSKPVLDHTYSNEAAREAAVRRAFEGRRAHKERVAVNRTRKSPVAQRNAAAKRALEAAFGRGSVKVKGGSGTAHHGWLSISFGFPLGKKTYAEGLAEVVKILTDAGIELGSDTADYGGPTPITLAGRWAVVSLHRLSLSWADA